MTLRVAFVMTQSALDVIKSLGITDFKPANRQESCPFMVGDFITFAAAPTVTFRVAWRLYAHGASDRPDEWRIALEQADLPSDARTQATPPRN